MAKAIKLWYGKDTFGNSVEVAQREDGVCFSRHDYRNDYGQLSTTKWQYHEPSFAIKTTNAYSGDIIEHPDDPIMCWGFQRLSLIASVDDGDKIRLRLPN